MAGNAKITEKSFPAVNKIKFEWTADQNGNVSTHTTNNCYTGKVLSAVFTPGTGRTKPLNLYNVIVRDQEGHDTLLGQGKALNNSETICKSDQNKLGAVDNSPLTLIVTSAGKGGQGSVILWIK